MRKTFERDGITWSRTEIEPGYIEIEPVNGEPVLVSSTNGVDWAVESWALYPSERKKNPTRMCAHRTRHYATLYCALNQATREVRRAQRIESALLLSE